MPIAKPKQGQMPVALQYDWLAKKNARLLNCWIGIGIKETIGTRFCIGCEYLEECLKMYVIFDGIRRMHPSYLARETLKKFGINSDYIKDATPEE